MLGELLSFLEKMIGKQSEVLFWNRPKEKNLVGVLPVWPHSM